MKFFRTVVTIGVAISAIAILILTGVMIALMRTAKRLESATATLVPMMEPALQRAGPLAEHALAAVQAAKPVLERIGPMMDTARPVIAKIGPLIDSAKPVVAKTTEVIGTVNTAIGSVNEVIASVKTAIDENRPKVAQISEETAAIVHSGREQVERLGNLLEDAATRARQRLEQIDSSVESTMGQINDAGENVKRAVLRPMREVNGLSAGFAAAMAALVHGRKSSVDNATQDEEMFI